MASSWNDVLDSIACQVDLQDRSLRLGHDAPPDLEIDVPDCDPSTDERLRAAVLHARCEELANLAAERVGGARRFWRSPYGRVS